MQTIIPKLQGRMETMKVTVSCFTEPVARITANNMEEWLHSEAYARILDFVQSLNMSVKNKKLTDPCEESVLIASILSMLDRIDSWIAEIPPDQGEQRFGNTAFRKWLQKVCNVPLFNLGVA
jgi:serine/threonine-protein phosphatase 2A activator